MLNFSKLAYLSKLKSVCFNTLKACPLQVARNDILITELLALIENWHKCITNTS